MSRLMGPPDKFLPSEWKHANQVQFRSSEAERSHSQRLTAECQSLIEESDKSTKRMQQDALKKLEQRIQDIKFWRLELNQKFEEMVQEIETLIIFKSRVERALESCSEPFQVTLQCLTERQKRVAIDLVHDEVEEELLKEKEVIEGVMVLLQRTLEQINEQIRLIRSVKYYLEKDLQDKFQAEHIDDFCSLLTNASPGLNGGNSNFTSLGISRSAVTPEEWESLCNLNISKAEKEKNNSLSLRALVDSLLEQTAADMHRQYEATGRAFELRIEETKTAKAQLENQLNELLAETANQEKNLESLRVAIAEKEAPLKVAQTRLSTRSQRPNVELCHDPAQIRLLEEVKELASHIERLTEALELSEMELKALASRQLSLEEEIQVKTNSLYIDESEMLQTLLFILTIVLMTSDVDPVDLTDMYSIRVKESFTGEAGLCIRVDCFFTVPQSVSDPIRRTWFKGDPQNPAVQVPCVGNLRECSFLLNHLVQGESDGEYRLKLEWEQGEVFIFPQTVHITVKELTQKPTINVPPLTEGDKAEISCKVPGDCINPTANVVWEGIEPDGVERRIESLIGEDNFAEFSTLTFHPELKHHNTNLTCTDIFQGNIQTESTVILKVRHNPTILDSSRCFVWGDELSCMCVSSGEPLPQIYWLIPDGASEYYSAVSEDIIISIITISIASFGNFNATFCVSENLIGLAIMEIEVHGHAEKPKENWSFSTPWIFFTLSVVLNVIFASWLTVVLRRARCKKPKDDVQVYMTAMKREESV
uniref:Tektin-1 n=1 Tax=Cyprinus carpio TaxID=7962 RepID=A0A8C2EB00_CYPCA